MRESEISYQEFLMRKRKIEEDYDIEKQDRDRENLSLLQEIQGSILESTTNMITMIMQKEMEAAVLNMSLKQGEANAGMLGQLVSSMPPWAALLLTGVFMAAIAGLFSAITPSEGLADGGQPAGRVRGPGGVKDDRVRTNLSPEEHVWSEREVQGAGGHDEMERMRQDARDGKLRPRNRAQGGKAAWESTDSESLHLIASVDDGGKEDKDPGAILTSESLHLIASVDDGVTDPGKNPGDILTSESLHLIASVDDGITAGGGPGNGPGSGAGGNAGAGGMLSKLFGNNSRAYNRAMAIHNTNGIMPMIPESRVLAGGSAMNATRHVATTPSASPAADPSSAQLANVMKQLGDAGIPINGEIRVEIEGDKLVGILRVAQKVANNRAYTTKGGQI
jgi:hypothetical protein